MDNADVVFLTAEDEEAKIIGQGNAPLTEEGEFIRDVVKCRQEDVYKRQVQAMVLART